MLRVRAHVAAGESVCASARASVGEEHVCGRACKRVLYAGGKACASGRNLGALF